MKREITLVLDPRFPGGTSSAVARELHALARIARVKVVVLHSNMFKGTTNNPLLAAAFDDLDIVPAYNPATINSDIVVVHNPSFLKYNSTLGTKIICNRLITVAHENFLRPNGQDGFDVSGCLAMLENACLARQMLIAPVSGYNRDTISRWLARNGGVWKITGFDWFNICDFALTAPTSTPKDRRGRLSRAGFEKFPAPETLNILFPETADYCGILGADSLGTGPQSPAHWDLYKFREIPVETFLKKIDFFVYYTHPNLQESFGRVIAEAIAAGKPVITDSRTARTFGSAVISATPDKVGAIISRLVSDPTAYVAQVRAAQRSLSRFSPSRFTAQLDNFINTPHEVRFDFM